MSEASASPPTRERIRHVAQELYVLNGCDGFSFGDIAAAIGTTRANIHHHFGNKRRLMAELIEGFVADAEARIAHHWSAPASGSPNACAPSAPTCAPSTTASTATPRAPCVEPDRAASAGHPGARRTRHRRPGPDQPRLRTALRQALAEAVEAGEFRRDVPADDIVHLLRLTLLSCAPATQDTGSFREVDRLLQTLSVTLLAAWGA